MPNKLGRSQKNASAQFLFMAAKRCPKIMGHWGTLAALPWGFGPLPRHPANKRLKNKML